MAFTHATSTSVPSHGKWTSFVLANLLFMLFVLVCFNLTLLCLIIVLYVAHLLPIGYFENYFVNLIAVLLVHGSR